MEADIVTVERNDCGVSLWNAIHHHTALKRLNLE
jgi:hypothetical protein